MQYSTPAVMDLSEAAVSAMLHSFSMVCETFRCLLFLILFCRKFRTHFVFGHEVVRGDVQDVSTHTSFQSVRRSVFFCTVGEHLVHHLQSWVFGSGA